MAVRCPSGEEICISEEAHLALHATGPGPVSPRNRELEAFHLQATAASCVRLKVVDNPTAAAGAIVETGGSDGSYDLAGFVEAGDSALLLPGSRFYLSGRQADGVFTVVSNPSISCEGGGNVIDLVDSPLLTEPKSREVPQNHHDQDRPPASGKRKRSELSPVPGQACPFGLLQLDPSHDVPHSLNRGALGVQLANLVQADGLCSVFICNYYVDVGFLAQECPALLNPAVPVVIVHGFKDPSMIQATKDQIQQAGLSHWSVYNAAMPDPYGTHHSKAFLLEYRTGLRIVITTANLIRNDCHDKTQAIWWQDFPRKANNSNEEPSQFEKDLLFYLKALYDSKQWDPEAQRLAMAESKSFGPRKRALLELCSRHDFSDARAKLLVTVPGRHREQNLHRCGHMQLRRLLADEAFPELFARSPVVAQFSSIGTTHGTKSDPGKWRNEVTDSLSAGKIAAGSLPGQLGRACKLQIVWPTVEEVRESFEGYMAGGSLPGRREHLAPLEGQLHQWGGGKCGRGRASPHIKTYCRHQEGKIAWVVVTSSNLSKAAWGVLEKNGTQLYCKSYELGVLLLPRLCQTSRPPFRCAPAPSLAALTPSQESPAGRADIDKASDSDGLQLPSGDETEWFRSLGDDDTCAVRVPIPYALPPRPYSPGDVAWAVDNEQRQPDRFGCLWPPRG